MCTFFRVGQESRRKSATFERKMTDMSLDELLEEDDDDFDRGRIPSLNTVGSDVFDELFDDDEEDSESSPRKPRYSDNSTVDALPPPSYDDMIKKIDSPILEEKAERMDREENKISDIEDDETKLTSNPFESVVSSQNIEKDVSALDDDRESNPFEAVSSLKDEEEKPTSTSNPFETSTSVSSKDEEEKPMSTSNPFETSTSVSSKVEEEKPMPTSNPFQTSTSVPSSKVEEETQISNEKVTPSTETPTSNTFETEKVEERESNTVEAETIPSKITETTKNETKKRKKWKCPRCTLRNELSVSICAVCSLPRPKESETTESGRKRLSAVEVLFENAKEHEKHLREDTVEKPLDLLHVEAAGQSGLAEDIFRFEDTTLKNVSMTSILLDNKWIVMGTKNGDVVLYVVCEDSYRKT